MNVIMIDRHLWDRYDKAAVEADTGIRPPQAAEMFTDSAADNRPVDARFKASPFVPCKDAIRGFVFNVMTGRQAERGF